VWNVEGKKKVRRSLGIVFSLRQSEGLERALANRIVGEATTLIMGLAARLFHVNSSLPVSRVDISRSLSCSIEYSVA
jgi:hypothetical protein